MDGVVLTIARWENRPEEINAEFHTLCRKGKRLFELRIPTNYGQKFYLAFDAILLFTIVLLIELSRYVLWHVIPFMRESDVIYVFLYYLSWVHVFSHRRFTSIVLVFCSNCTHSWDVK